ncbi:MAG: DUF1064 domain-containing protein [Patescibacteria group bacterium]|jgi:hypothetical protein
MNCPSAKTPCKHIGNETVCRACPHTAGTTVKENIKVAAKTPGQSKYNAVMCEADGIKFRSKKERQRYLELWALREAREVRYFHRQVAFDLPGNTRYIVDFEIIWNDGEVTYEDVKGVKLPAFIKNKKQVEALYPVKILDPYEKIMIHKVGRWNRLVREGV